jgi:hypothetical protein
MNPKTNPCLNRFLPFRIVRAVPFALWIALLCAFAGLPSARAAEAETKPLSNNDDNASIQFHAVFPRTKPEEKEEKLIYTTHLSSLLRIQPHRATQSNALAVTIIQGKLKELALKLEGQGDVSDVQGPGLLDWGMRRATNGQRFLVIHLLKPFQLQTNLAFTVQTTAALTNAPLTFSPLVFAPETASLFDGFVRVEMVEELEVTLARQSGLVPIESKFLPGPTSPRTKDATNEALQFRFSGSPYALTLNIAEADPDLRKVRFQDFRLVGAIHGDLASFDLSGNAIVKHPQGGTLEVLSGAAALTDYAEQPGVRLELHDGRYRLVFATNGTFTVNLKFDARVEEANGWRRMTFETAPSSLRPIVLRGLPGPTQIQFKSAAQAQRVNDEFLSFLPAAGPMELQWQEARPEVEGKLFYAVTDLSQISVSPGLVRQTGLFEYKVMQGELRQLTLTLDGEGEVTRVLGNGILAWRVVPAEAANRRRLVVELNESQKETYLLAVQTQTPLGAFPLKFKPLRMVPVNAIRFGGHIRVVNAGAVRLEVLNAPGLAQISPQMFPQTQGLDNLTDKQRAQAFAFRFSGSEFDLEIQADNVLPELSVSELLLYHLGETENALDAELELDIREAPLREFEILVPEGYSVAFLNAPSLSDYSVGTAVENGAVPLKIQFGEPLLGRQLIQLRLTRSHAAPEQTWNLVPLQPRKVKSVRGFVGLSADPGLRLTESRTKGLTELATAFFPKRVKDLQLAYRLRDEAWEAVMTSERLALSIQVDSLQLFSAGEGIAYGSTVLNYLIAGAPVATLKVQVPTNYANVEFVGQDVRNWKQTDGGYEVYLHSPVSGTYSLLATYDLQFNPRGQELLFTGIQPLEVQSDQGYVIVVSPYQFQTEPVEASPGLIPLEPGEIPTEYRLLFDAPILASYQFTSRPFQLKLKLTTLAQGETVNQVVDRASFNTHVSGQGQALTDVRYFIKSQGHSHLRLVMPEGASLWSVSVNGKKVVPVTDQLATLVPLPQDTAPNTVIPLDLKVAAKSKNATQVRVVLPKVEASILLADWRIEPDDGYRIEFERGQVAPFRQPADISGFAWVQRLVQGQTRGQAGQWAVIALACLILGAVLWRWATRPGMMRFSLKNLLGFGLGGLAFLMAFVALFQLVAFALGHGLETSSQISFLLPVQAPGSAFDVTLDNQDLKDLAGAWLVAWPVYLGLVAWIYFLATKRGFARLLGITLGWTLVLWGCLRVANGAGAFFVALGLFAFVHTIIPLLRREWQLPRQVKPSENVEPSPAGGVAVLILFGMLLSQVTSAVGTTEGAGLFTARKTILPLPQGEGRGEGEQAKATGPSATFSPKQGKASKAELQSRKGFENELNQEGCSTPALRGERSHGAICTPFPLTLTLSPGEREQHGGAVGITEGAGLFTVRKAILPLPQGEGRGEGEQAKAIPPMHSLRLTPSTALGLLTISAVSFLPLPDEKIPSVVKSVIQTARVREDRVFVQAKMRWTARENQVLDFLHQPAVLTRIDYPRSDLRLIEETVRDHTVYRLVAQRAGEYSIDLEYELALEHQNAAQGFHLPTHDGLVNRLTLALDRADMEIASPEVVSVRSLEIAPEEKEMKSRFDLVLSPAERAWIAWKPRSRDIRAEKTLFYGELFQLYIPTAGIIEGVHDAQIRLAQGQISELIFQTPDDMTITDVQGPSLAGWKFDPDNRRLRVQFESPQAKPFAVRLQSQITTSPLPFQRDVGLITLEQSAGQVGLVAVATGADVQLDSVTNTALSSINLEDFPSTVLAEKTNQIAGLTIRRAYRAGDPGARLTLAASAVQPDVRVTAQQTLSLGEDRMVLAAKLDVNITRAGVFKLSFVLPAGMDVESLSGDAFSHWTELKTGQERIITMHLQGKTDGAHSFSVSLSGPGLPAAGAWQAPRLVLREASKQTGQLVVVPEQGMRLHVSTREGLTQLDPKTAGIRQKGVLAFRLLQSDWRLGFDVEKVDPWVQVETLQETTLREGPVKVSVTLDYKIENAGLKSLFLELPANADGVRFSGEQVSDAVKTEPAPAQNQTREWEVKLDRRVIGPYRLQLNYQVPSGASNALETVVGVQAKQVNLQRGYVTIRTGGRLQLSIPRLPSALQPVDWRSIPPALRGGAGANEGNFTFRALEPDYQLTLNVVRHQAAHLLPARVEKTELTSTLSDAGEMLTQVRLTLQPGDKRSLRLKLPASARFWFAFVNNAGVWPWRENDEILIPLEPAFKPGQPILAEFLYSVSTRGKSGRSRDFSLLGPQFDLPLENVSWLVYLPQDRELKDWEGTLQLQEKSVAPGPRLLDLQSYLQGETSQQKEQSREAETMLQLGNDYLARGQQEQARKAFQSAWSLSQHDDAFNEDARVQLHNLKMQQALVGLNYRRNAAFQDQAAAPEGAATNTALNILKANQPPSYTQQQVQQALGANSAEDNTALMRLAEHLIQQQDAAQAAPEAIRASLPEQGNRVTFTRSLFVDPYAPLKLDLETKSVLPATRSTRFWLLIGLFAGLTLLMFLAKSGSKGMQPE